MHSTVCPKQSICWLKTATMCGKPGMFRNTSQSQMENQPRRRSIRRKADGEAYPTQPAVTALKPAHQPWGGLRPGPRASRWRSKHTAPPVKCSRPKPEVLHGQSFCSQLSSNRKCRATRRHWWLKGCNQANAKCAKCYKRHDPSFSMNKWGEKRREDGAALRRFKRHINQMHCGPCWELNLKKINCE